MRYYPEPDSHIRDKVKVLFYQTCQIMQDLTVDLKQLSDVVDNEDVKNKKINILKTRVVNFRYKIPDATTLIYINQ